MFESRRNGGEGGREICEEKKGMIDKQERGREFKAGRAVGRSLKKGEGGRL